MSQTQLAGFNSSKQVFSMFFFISLIPVTTWDRVYSSHSEKTLVLY